MTTTMEFSQLFTLEPPVKGRPFIGPCPARGVMRADHVQMNRRIAELMKGCQRNVKAFSWLRVSDEEQLEWTLGEVTRCRVVEPRVDHRWLDRHDAWDVLQDRRRPREHQVGNID